MKTGATAPVFLCPFAIVRASAHIDTIALFSRRVALGNIEAIVRGRRAIGVRSAKRGNL